MVTADQRRPKTTFDKPEMERKGGEKTGVV